MTDWTAGYIADIGYTFGYYAELNPLRVKLAFLNCGLVPPEFGTACELGFGQGMSVNMHAAASMTEWYGTDFNPSQAGCAREFADASGAPAYLYDEAFSEFVDREDLPDFDYIGLHGIWSWISDENRALIVEFVRRRLKVGGVLYVSYNTLPGWAAFAPMRQLMTEHAEVIGSEGRGIVSRIDDAVEFADKLLETNPLFARANPLVGDRVKKLKGQNRHYLAHEYFNRDWHPMHFASMAEWLEPAKLSYACSAHYMDHIDTVNLSKDQQGFLAEIPDRMFRESVRDFMVNQQFRRDYWVKGARHLSPLEKTEALQAVRVVLTTHRPDVSLKVNGAAGEATMSESIYNPVLDALADHKPQSIDQLRMSVEGVGVNLGQLVQALFVLAGAGHLAPVQDDEVMEKVRKQTSRLNAHIMRKARGSSDIAHLASPVTGGAVSVNRIHQLFLLARTEGQKQPEEWVESAWRLLEAQGQKLIKDGKTIETREDNLSELRRQANEFSDKQLPLLKALLIA